MVICEVICFYHNYPSWWLCKSFLDCTHGEFYNTPRNPPMEVGMPQPTSYYRS